LPSIVDAAADLVDRAAEGDAALPRDIAVTGDHALEHRGVDGLLEAALAAATRVHLRLDDPEVAAEVGRRLDGVVDRGRGRARGHGDAEPLQEFLRLVLVQLHRLSSSVRWSNRDATPAVGAPDSTFEWALGPAGTGARRW